MTDTQGKFNPSEHLSDILDKDGNVAKYLQVQWRLQWFLSENKGWSIISPADMQVTDTLAVCKTEILDADRNLRAVAVGTAYSSEPYRYIETAATRSLGRALALLGYGNIGDDVDKNDPVDAGVRTIEPAPAKEEDLPFSDDPVPATPAPAPTPVAEPKKGRAKKAAPAETQPTPVSAPAPAPVSAPTPTPAPAPVAATDPVVPAEPAKVESPEAPSAPKPMTLEEARNVRTKGGVSLGEMADSESGRWALQGVVKAPNCTEEQRKAALLILNYIAGK